MPRTRFRVRSRARSSCGFLLLVAERPGRLADLLAQCLQVRAERGFKLFCIVGHAAVDQLLRVFDHVPHLLAADAGGRFVQLARSIPLAAPRVVGQLLELLLEPGDLRSHGGLLVDQFLALSFRCRALIELST